jgi:hypothetical protein
MPHEITFDNLPAGYAAESVPKGSTSIKVQSVGFASSEDGDKLIRLLDGISDAIISRLPKAAGIQASRIDHLIAVIRKNKTATVYVNEVTFIGHVQSMKTLNPGDPIFSDDIADIIKVEPQGITIPTDAGLVVIISNGWRKGLFFDYSPIMPQATGPRTYNVEILLGQLYSYLAFQDRLKIDATQWIEFLRQQWFPFISLGSKRIRTMIDHVSNKWDLDSLLDEIEADVKGRTVGLLSLINQNELFDGHRDIFKSAIEHFKSGDYATSTALLYPRIEGLMRVHHTRINPTVKPGQKTLAESATADPKGIRHAQSLLLPERFRQFLNDVYFANFDPAKVTNISRHTVAHGVAPDSLMSKKKPAILGVLILEQLVYLMH